TIEEGASLGKFRAKIEDELGRGAIGPAHLENVYRTNIQRAFHDGYDEIANDPVVNELFPFQEYIPIHDSRTREEHLQLGKLGLDGTGVYWADDPMWELFSPPWDYQCILPGNLVAGRIHSGLKSFYDGQAVEILTAEGNRLTLTVNHPVFTPRGRVAAGALREGDYLFCDQVWPERLGGLSAPCGHEHDRPATVGQGCGSLRQRHGGIRVPVGANHLHGDATFCNGYIEVVGANRKLLENQQAALLDSLGNFALASMYLRLVEVAHHRQSARLGKRPLALGGLPCRAALPDNLFAVLLDTLPLFLFGLRSATDGNTGANQSVFDGRSVASVPGGERLEGFASGIKGDNFINGQFNPR